MDILEEIVAHKRQEIAERKHFIPARELYVYVNEAMQQHPSLPSLREALQQSDTGIIAEFKRKSPSKGWIHQDAKVREVAPAYQKAGATAMSILTDTDYFGGYDEFIQEARAIGVTIPILYKNFIVDEYQLFQARQCGASAVLLITAVLSIEECKYLIKTAHDLGMEVLLEMHNEHDLDYADLDADVCGINNRDLGTFTTDVHNSFRLAERLPAGVCKISESGISSPQTVRELREAGFNGFLMGEHFMKETNPGEALLHFINQLKV